MVSADFSLIIMNSSRGSRRDEATLLLADADKLALLQTRTQLVGAGIRSLIEEVADAPGLILALTRRLRHDTSALPLVVFMEVSMRKTSGFDALAWIRNEPSLGDLPVIILTASEDEAQISKAYQLGADGYLLKGKNIEAFTYIYQQAHRVRAGEIPRAGAFATLPGNKRIAEEEELSYTPGTAAASDHSAA